MSNRRIPEKTVTSYTEKTLCMAKSKNIFVRIGRFYIDGFKNMTWGWQLWALILLKILILFAILRVFFFKPVLAGKSDKEKSEIVGAELIAPLEDAVPLPLQD